MNINQLFSLAHHSLNVAEMQRNRFLFEKQEFQQLQQKKRLPRELAQKHRELDTRIQKGEEVVEDEEAVEDDAEEDDAVLLQTIQSILGRGGE